MPTSNLDSLSKLALDALIRKAQLKIEVSPETREALIAHPDEVSSLLVSTGLSILDLLKLDLSLLKILLEHSESYFSLASYFHYESKYSNRKPLLSLASDLPRFSYLLSHTANLFELMHSKHSLSFLLGLDEEKPGLHFFGRVSNSHNSREKKIKNLSDLTMDQFQKFLDHSHDAWNLFSRANIPLAVLLNLDPDFRDHLFENSDTYSKFAEEQHKLADLRALPLNALKSQTAQREIVLSNQKETRVLMRFGFSLKSLLMLPEKICQEVLSNAKHYVRLTNPEAGGIPFNTLLEKLKELEPEERLELLTHSKDVVALAQVHISLDALLACRKEIRTWFLSHSHETTQMVASGASFGRLSSFRVQDLDATLTRGFHAVEADLREQAQMTDKTAHSTRMRNSR